jgi:CDP-glucose 4,6-dehydratase
MEGLGLMSRLPEASFWRGRRVLITGHTGFKGGWLCTWLKSMGAEIAGLSLPPEACPNVFNVAEVANGMDSRFGDIRDADLVRQIVSEISPEIVIHMAAQALVRRSYADPIETYETNVMGTVHILEAVKSVGTVKALVNVTSDKCYENHEWVWGYREDESMGGHDPYSSSKGCAELITSAYRRFFFDDHGIALATARAGNVIGGGDWSNDRIVPDVLRALDQGLPVLVRNPRSIRPWQHVLEPLSGYLILAQALFEGGKEFAGAWNFGPVDQDAKTVESLVGCMCELWGTGATWHVADAEGLQHHEARYLKLDASKARHFIGWSPRWRLEQALIATIEWHRVWTSRGDCKSLMLEQIKNYLQSSVDER